MNDTEPTRMKILGEVDIPYYQGTKESLAKDARKVLNMLHPGKAIALEFGCKKEAQDMRSMLYTMAILKFAEAGHIKTKVLETLMYVWLVEPDNDKKEQ